MEVWKDIPGYEGLYQASSEGRIRTCEGKTTSSARFPKRHWKQRILKYRGETYQTGYRVGLWKNGEETDWLVARLIAMTFIRIPNSEDTVNHIDGNRFNNHVENLEWVTLKENIQHAFRTGLMSTQHPTYLIEKKTYKIFSFRSEAEASRFLLRSSGYISNSINKGKRDLGDYMIAEIPNPFSRVKGQPDEH